MRLYMGLTLIAVIGFLTATVAEDKKEVKIDGMKLIGKWLASETSNGPMEFEYFKDGTVKIKLASGLKVEGKYVLNGNKLTETLKLDEMSKPETVTITKLTNDRLEFDAGGDKWTLKRLIDN